jgi:hypothetical protein
VENCVIRNNTMQDSALDSGGGGVRLAAGTLRNSTVVMNICEGTHEGGGVRQSGGTMVNCIVWSNTVATGIANADYSGDAQDATYSCAPELTAGEGNRTTDPLFTAPLSDDYRLLPTSLCVNTGANQLDWMATARDLDGNPRIQCGVVDMGAYEWVPPRGILITVR